MLERRTDYRALGALVLGACGIGFSPILVRLAEAGPAAAGFWRLGFALPLLLAMSWRAEGAVRPPSRLALLAGLAFALDLGFWHYGIAYTSVANATVLSNLTPVVVTAVAWLFLKQQPRALFVAAVGVAVGGAWLMATAAGGGPGRNPPLGNALSAMTAFWYALYFLAMGEARKRQGASVLMLWSGAVGAPLLLGAALLMGEEVLPRSAYGWAACVGLGLTHVAGQGAIAWAMGRLSTATTSVTVLIQPVVAGGLGWMLFAEAIGPLQGLGAALTLGGVALAQLSGRSKD